MERPQQYYIPVILRQTASGLIQMLSHGPGGHIQPHLGISERRNVDRDASEERAFQDPNARVLFRDRAPSSRVSISEESGWSLSNRFKVCETTCST